MDCPSLGGSVDRLAIIMLSAIGDSVHVLPVVNALKRADPQLHITWVIQPVPHQLVKAHPAVDEFILFHRRRGARLLGGFARTLGPLRRTRFDLVLGLQVYLKAGILLAATRSKVKLGFDRARARDLNWLFSTHRIPAHAPQHVQDQYFEFLDFLGVDRRQVEWGLTLTAEERRAQQEFFAPLDKPVCAVVVATSRPEKNWQPERYARLLEFAEFDLGLQPVIVGGPSAVERQAASEIQASTRAHTVNALGDSVRRLLYLLDGSALVVSPDTGPLHIARALDVPVVGLYGFTNPKRSGPYAKYQELVADGYARFPGEDYPISMQYRKNGMQRVTVEMAAEKLELAKRTYVDQSGPRSSPS